MKRRINTNRKKRRGGGNTTNKDGTINNYLSGFRRRTMDIPNNPTSEPTSFHTAPSTMNTIPFFNTFLQIILFLFLIGLCYYLIQNKSKIWGR